MNNNHLTVHPTTDGSMDTRYRFMESEFMGKATAGHGTGGANDGGAIGGCGGTALALPVVPLATCTTSRGLTCP